MLNKIILLDQRGLVINSILESDNILIDTAVITSRSQLENIPNKGETNFIFRDDGLEGVYTNSYSFFDYDVLLDFKHTELKVLSYFSRFTSDITAVRYIYAAALFYWFEKFKDPCIVGVFCNEAEHGGLHDSVVLDVAKYYGKKIYVKSVRYGNYKGYALDAVFDYNNKCYLNLSNLLSKKSPLSLEGFIFNSNIDDEIEYYGNVRVKNHGRIKAKRLIASSVEKSGGPLLLMLIAKIIGKYRGSSFGFDVPLSRYLYGQFVCKSLSRYYKKYAVKQASAENYIFLALHMEPEASIQVNTKFSDQLTIIKQVSNALPEGWVLYVKEHPHQFSLNSADRSYYLPGVYKFRSKRFYDEIIKLENVKILDINLPSKDLISKSRAVVTLSGTASTEAVVNKKPTIIFSQNTSTLALVDGVYDVSNSEQLSEAIKEVKKTRSVEYNNLNSVISDYHLFSDGVIQENILELIDVLYGTPCLTKRTGSLPD